MPAESATARDWPFATSTVRVRAVHADGVEQERPYLRTRQTLTFQFGGKLQLGGAERAWHRAEVKGKSSRARKAVVITSFVRKGDQLVWWAGGNSVPRQQPQKLIILRVGVRNSSRHEYSGGCEGRKKWLDVHG